MSGCFILVLAKWVQYVSAHANNVFNSLICQVFRACLITYLSTVLQLNAVAFLLVRREFVSFVKSAFYPDYIMYYFSFQPQIVSPSFLYTAF